MQRYFLKNEQFQGEKVCLLHDDAHHISRVMRMKTGDKIIVCNEEQACYELSLTSVDAQEVTGVILKSLEQNTELPIEVTIAQGIPKGDKWEWVLQKGTECGASQFIPVKMERCVVKLEAKKEAKKLERWEKIVKEAAEQAHRQRVPRVLPSQDFKAFLKLAATYDCCLFAYEEVAKRGQLAQLKQTLTTVAPGSSLLILVGPEGGISESEEVLLQEAGFAPCALGSRILRTETAPIYILSAISYALEL